MCGRKKHTYLDPSPEIPTTRDVQGFAGTYEIDPMLQVLLEATDSIAFILNAQCQTVGASQPLLRALGLEDITPILGLPPCKILRCVEATTDQGECGQSTACGKCSIPDTIETCRSQGTVAESESTISMDNNSSARLCDFRVRAIPLHAAQEDLVLLVLKDLNDRKRLEALEDFFFHSVLNLTNGMDGTVRIMTAEPESAPLLVRQLADFTEQLTQEVLGQRILIQAENGSLQMEPQEIEVAEIMESLSAFFRNHDAAHKRHLLIHPFRSERFQTDPTLLLRILEDLMTNAFEATPIDGTVQVWYQREEHKRRFVVQNESLIPPEMAPRIFLRSFSTKAVRRNGLGTFGIRLLAERYLGGRVDFRSEAGLGTRFFLHLPAPEPTPELYAPSEDASHAQVVTESVGAAKEKLGTVLVVDDARVVRHLLYSILSKDFHLILSENGPDGLAAAAEFHPDLVLLDVIMPGMNGYTVCEYLKANPETENTPVIFITSLTNKADETRALEAGAIDFITKPINPDVVYARVRNHVEMKRAQDHLKDLSLLDALTGIANRRAFDAAIDHEWRRGIRSRKPLSVILGDVDFFKLYNDSLGHPQGDVCLQQVAQAFARSVHRPSDTVARYGGEEFICVLGDTDTEGALLVAEKIRTGLEALGLPHPDSTVGPCVTVSLGLATMVPVLESSFSALIEEADRRLYEAKTRGRNQVVGPP